MSFKEFILSMLKDEQGNISSKRFLGTIGTLSFFGSMIYFHNDILISNGLILILGLMGLTSLDKFTNNNKKDEDK